MKTSQFIIALCGLAIAGCGGSGGGDTPVRNAPPTLSAIADQTVTANEVVAPIGFSVADDATSAEALAVTAMTIDQGVIVDANLEVAGDGTARSLIVTPVADEIGNAVISIMVTDEEGLSNASSFGLTVEPQRKPISEFTRSNFMDSEEGDPTPINAIVFDEDAEEDEFEDLLDF